MVIWQKIDMGVKRKMTLFFLVFLIIIIFLIIKTNNRIFNEIFWMFVFWGLIIGVLLFRCKKWKYSVSIDLIVYLMIAFFSHL